MGGTYIDTHSSSPESFWKCLQGRGMLSDTQVQLSVFWCTNYLSSSCRDHRFKMDVFYSEKPGVRRDIGRRAVAVSKLGQVRV